MDMATIAQLIGSLGFPIVAYFVMMQELSKERESHREEMNELRDVIEKNTNALNNMAEVVNTLTKGAVMRDGKV